MLLFLDIESSGLDPNRHSILSIGAINKEGTKEFYTELVPGEGSAIDSTALEVNGFQQGELFDSAKPSQTEGLTDFTNFLNSFNETIIPVGMNVWWDMLFLKKSAERFKIELKAFGHKIIDLHSLVYTAKNGYTSEDKVSSKEVWDFCFLPDEEKPHNALTGAKYNRQAYFNFVNRMYV